MIGVVLPTRGFVFTEVEQSIADNLRGFDYKVYRSYDLPIPDGHNDLVEEAIKDKNDYILFVEEDTVIPEGGVRKMINEDKSIAFIDYGVQGWSCSAKDKQGEILWCGLGCTLVRKEVFDSIAKPYFRTDKSLRLNDWTWVDLPQSYVKNKVYGGHDIWFFCKAREKGFKITQIPGECKHLGLKQLGQRETNNGFHVIEEKPKITKLQII